MKQIKCRKCKGEGKYVSYLAPKLGWGMMVTTTPNYYHCHDCKGTGYKTKMNEVKI